MRGNPNGFLSSAGRFATCLLSFRYTVGTFLSSHSGRRLAVVLATCVAAGASPAARALSVSFFACLVCFARSDREGAVEGACHRAALDLFYVPVVGEACPPQDGLDRC